MALRSVTVERYRCFDRAQSVELRPLTVLLGRNNSGKSTLARLPLLLATGYRGPSEAPVDIEVPGVDIAGAFTDLIFGQRPHGNIVLGATFDGLPNGVVATSSLVQHIDEYQTQVVSRFALVVAGRELVLDWEAGDPRTPRWLASLDGGPPVPTDVSFRGLLPNLAGFRSTTEPPTIPV
jgi:hypothetical protein